MNQHFGTRLTVQVSARLFAPAITRALTEPDVPATIATFFQQPQLHAAQKPTAAKRERRKRKEGQKK